MNSTSITSYILELEKLNEESRTKIEQLKKLLNEANEEKVAALNKLNSLYDTTTRVTKKCVNQGIVDRLLELGEMTSDFYKAGAYQSAANVISSLDYEVESGESVLHINGIGKGIANKIDEYLEEQDSDYEESVASNDYESDDDFFISYNNELADIFDSLSYYEDDEHKAKAYDHAAYNISKLPFKVTNGKELSKGPKKVPGIGKSIAKIIDEFLETGKVKKLENLKSASTNEEIAWALNMCASEESDPHKIRAYKRAAEIIGELDFEVTSGEELAKGPHKIEGIGKGIAKKIDEFLQTGEIKSKTPSF
jgi:DNA polymerase/3'-5' exonuclease PolX